MRNVTVAWTCVAALVVGLSSACDGSTVAPVASAKGASEKATFAGGCFWCMESSFEGLPGVLAVVSGYAGGTTKNPTYEQVGSGSTGHAESIQVTFDAAKTSYAQLLDAFWHNIDPLAGGGQFCDHGTQYRSAIFYVGEAQRQAAEASKQAIEAGKRFDKPIVTQIVPLEKFYPAEEYHQDYYKKNPLQYKMYRLGCGRDARLHELWGDAAGGGHVAAPARYGKPSDAELRQRLTPLQYEVTQHAATEHAFDNAYWDNHEPGIYVDVVSGEPLFSSQDKFDSGTGWPSFTRPLVPENVSTGSQSSLDGYPEVRSVHAGSHLGHVFPDGPKPTGQRYCMNSAALRFIPAAHLADEGYGEYAKRFK
jgi:peptide methionine sulfoxide reductase msrA/msrB